MAKGGVMTTIAFDGEYLVADGRVTRGKEILTDTDLKITPCDFEYFDSGTKVKWQVTAFACSGSVYLAEKFEHHFKDRTHVRGIEFGSFFFNVGLPLSLDVILVTASGSFFCVSTGKHNQPTRTLKDGDVAILGSGRGHAVNLYRSAFDVVRHASLQDPYTGGVIRYYNCSTKESGVCTQVFLTKYRLEKKYEEVRNIVISAINNIFKPIMKPY